MRNLKSYFKNPFRVAAISNENLHQFATDHIGRMEAHNASHQFDSPIALTQALNNEYKLELVKLDTERIQQKSATMSLNELSETVKNRIRVIEAEAFIKYQRGTSKYMEYFPNGITEYTNANITTLEMLFSRLIDVVQQNIADWTTAYVDALIALKNQFVAQHQSQILHKGNVSTKRSERNLKRTALENMLFINLLNISLLHPDQPEMLPEYFDQTIIRLPETGEQKAPAEKVNILTGMVSDADDDEPIENAEVTLTNLGLTLSTDEDGEYYFDVVPYGTHQIKISYNGFETYTGTVNITPGEMIEHDVILKPLPIEEP